MYDFTPECSGLDGDDWDFDGLPDSCDPDDDNDGVYDPDDAFPFDENESLDTDQDGVGDNTDEDDDGDGVLDNDDMFPLDAAEFEDTDGDGVGNNADKDDDGDGARDEYEVNAGYDPLDPDSTPPNSTSAAFFVGKWIVQPTPGSIGVGPSEFSTAWWMGDASTIENRPCYYDDEYIFNADGSFSIDHQGETWLSAWQSGGSRQLRCAGQST